jgi:hypothetical protein
MRWNGDDCVSQGRFAGDSTALCIGPDLERIKQWSAALDPCRQANVGWLADDLRFTSNCLLPPKLPPSGVQREAPEISSIAARRPRR